ncbi:MetQ/NlpA family ABC transporter substrate-binding protein [Halomonas sp. SpR8]|uniref:MetQ/NlpA family ABC transporter substrate-binding protein n=1 Tax=Halomonas sp. SpR8 TaxID=3050463 RepID=UPI0027E3B9F8|nr:MetQ/NlpA family ABC transporter substrate-binding protein [Halomonas sp. SpR8]MDQ7731001.1 MetQ/NlpA family ABC transporter substrate-binding protein [Halomonas sp. SpR8]
MKLRSLLFSATLLAVSTASYADNVVRIGVTAGVNADALFALSDEISEHDIDLRVIEFNDWTLPNEALQNGDIDLNFFQHQAFLDNAIEQRGYELSMLGLGLLQNIGIYSNNVTDLADVPEGARVAVASDPVNQGRGLLLLQRAGLIELSEGDAIGATVHDITSNPHNLRFHEIDGPQIVRSLDDVDLAVSWPSHFVNAGRPEQAGEALIYSGIDDTFYAMGFVAQESRAEEPLLLEVVEHFQTSPVVRDTIDASYGGNPDLYTLPWIE